MSTHSIIPPSSAGIWGKIDGCTGWVLMSQMYPETEETIESKEGTASHEIGAELIEYAARGVNSTTKEEFVGETASNGVIFNEEMFNAAQIYAEDVAEVMRSAGVFGGSFLGIEQRLEMPKIHELSFGTTDCFLFDKQEKHLYIWDYKYGFGAVDAYENLQAINYLSGIIDRLELDGADDQETTVHIRIVQPRAYKKSGPIDEWIINLSDLRPYFNVLRNNADEALGTDSKINTGSHCKYCTARHACKAALEVGISLFELTMAPTPNPLDDESIGVQLLIIKRALESLKYLESGISAEVESRLKSGALIPNFTLTSSSGNKKWDKSVSEILALGKLLNIDLKKPDDVITPTQAKNKGVNGDLIKEYSSRVKNVMKLTPDDGLTAIKVFSK